MPNQIIIQPTNNNHFNLTINNNQFPGQIHNSQLWFIIIHYEKLNYTININPQLAYEIGYTN